MFDEVEQVVADTHAHLTVHIMGTLQGSALELIDNRELPLPEERRRGLEERGLGYLGVAGITPGGETRVAFTRALDNATVDAVVHAFLHLIASSSGTAPPNAENSERWLASLYDLPDTRPC